MVLWLVAIKKNVFDQSLLIVMFVIRLRYEEGSEGFNDG